MINGGVMMTKTRRYGKRGRRKMERKKKVELTVSKNNYSS
jgi:hypothetical protein